ncbi:MAG TPA: choice-of-anchor I family protein, partial [Bacteroidia bacterium]|nr:choice-of-anchor I family protein [Bacteroidia bacterium]
YSTATAGSDYTEQTVVVAAGVSGAQVITIPISNDVLAEKDEYIALAFTAKYNCTSSATAVYYLYIKDNDAPAPVATNELFLDSLSTFSNGASGSNSAEIVAHDPSTQRLYIANSIGAKLDIVDFTNPAAPTLITTINMTPTYGNINSVAVHDSVVALAIESTVSPQDSGKIVFLTYTGVFISQVKVGAMPDMITFNHAGTKVITVCEGEPNATYTNDPDGCVAIVDISAGVASVTSANVDFITFTSFNGQEASLRSQGIRIYGPFDMTSKDFEPEYITIADNDSIGWVTLQENNAIAKVDLITNTVIQLMPLGYKNYMTGPAALDASDNNGSINLMNAPVYGMYQPDAISHYTVNNQIYLITANEGDSREYTPVNEPVRVSSLTLDPVAFPYGTQMKQNAYLGRLNVTNETGDTDNDGDFDQLYTFGGRSFSIWNGTTGSQVYDSGDNLERVTSTHPVYAPLFNMSNGTGAGVAKNRSDDKGPEPEGTAVANMNGDNFLFLCLERVGGVIMYNVSNPAAPTYTGYYNHRTVTGGPDRGAEGIIFIPDSLSPNGNAIVIVANEVSSTLSIFQVNTCAQHAGVVVTPSSASACVGDTITLTANTVANTTYQWMMNGSNVVGETGTTLEVTTSGDYQLMITNSTNACSGKTSLVDVVIAPIPVVGSSATASTVCNGTATTLTGSGATTYNWMPGNLTGTSVAVTPSANTTYTVTGTTAGCSDTATVTINVLTRPTVTASTTANQVCNGNSTTLNTSGAATYNWQPVNVNGSSVSVTPTATTTYVVTGTAANGCTNTASIAIAVLPTPTVTATVSNNTVCSGNPTTLQGAGSGAVNYIWFPGLLSGQNVTTVPSATTTYTLTGYGTNGCTHTSTVAVTVNPSPALTTSGQTSICEGTSTTLGVTGAASYVWMPGSSTGTSITVQPASSATYTVTGTGANGCMDSAMVNVTVNANPVASLTTATDTACSNDGSVNLMGAPSGGTYIGNSVAGNTFTPSTAPMGVNTIDYVYTDANGCSDTANSTIVVDVCTGIESEMVSTVNAYPNPFSDQLTIISSSTIERVDVYSASGQLLFSQNGTSSKVELNMSGFESGIYFIRVTGGTQGSSVITVVRM